MGKAKFVVMLVFVLTLGSGLLAGMLIRHLPAISSAEAAPRSPLGEELGLSPEQNQKMRGIWESVRDKVDECFVRAQDAQKQRDEALFALLTDEQKVKFAAIQKQCADNLATLKAERDAGFQEAIKRTEQVLTESQRQRYREILQSRLSQGPVGEAPDWISPPTPAPMQPLR